MKQKHILYVIPYDNGKLIKIGKTRESNRKNRYRQIKRDFKKSEPWNGIEVFSSEKNIHELEQILHRMYYKERRDKRFKNGIGKTEWFDGKIFKDVKKEIERFAKTKKAFRNMSIRKIKDFEKEKSIDYLGLTLFLLATLIIIYHTLFKA